MWLTEVEEPDAGKRMAKPGPRSDGGKEKMKGGPWHPETQLRAEVSPQGVGQLLQSTFASDSLQPALTVSTF